jgi:anti-sigma B factor antagonist
MQNLNACAVVDEPGVAGPNAATNGESGRLTVRLISDARGVAVTLAGELDLATTPELDRHLAGIDVTQITRLLIDLSGVTFMDSTGLSSIIRAHHLAESSGHTLVVRRGPHQVQRLFEVTGVDERLTFEDD